jgi:large conductance mechanosensitive channel
MGMLQDFKSFALRGNVIDLAVAVIIGGAFQTVVTSLVNDMIMPPLGAVVSNVDFRDKYVPLFSQAQLAAKQDKLPEHKPGESYTPEQLKTAGLPVLTYGNFVTAIINFLILAFCVFLMVRALTYALRRMDVSIGPPPADAPPQEKLLREIRDLLKQQVKGT